MADVIMFLDDFEEEYVLAKIDFGGQTVEKLEQLGSLASAFADPDNMKTIMEKVRKPYEGLDMSDQDIGATEVEILRARTNAPQRPGCLSLRESFRYVKGTSPDAEEDKAYRHLGECPECRKTVFRYAWSLGL